MKDNDDNFIKDSLIYFFSAIIGITMLIIVGFGIVFIKDYILETKWDKLKNNCELSTILDNGDYQYECQIESNSTTVIYDKLDAQHWKKFKIKNNCRLIQINLTVLNGKNWLCDNNVNIYYDDDDDDNVWYAK